MSRTYLTFDCEGSALVGSLDAGTAAAGLLIVTGGNELRSGAWSGQAQIAARIAGKGFPVFRFDRRGVGDSEGGNGEFRSSAPDIAAALRAFRYACPQLKKVVGFGNCDAASALMLSHGAGFDALVLSNPWTIESGGDSETETPPEAVRDHYRRRLADPAAILRLLTGKVSLRKLAGSLKSAMRPAPPPGGLATELAEALAVFGGPAIFPLAERDRTAQAFLASWSKHDPRIRRCPDATHSFVEPHAQDWLTAQVLEMLEGV